MLIKFLVIFNYFISVCVHETPEFSIKNEIGCQVSLFAQLQKISGDILFKSLVGRIGGLAAGKGRRHQNSRQKQRDKKFGNDDEERVRLVR